jgi:hypothetical protein
MKLRDHPLMSHRGLRSWPPLWVRVDDFSKRPFEGDEVGTLTQVKLPNLADGKIFLRMNDGKNEYLSLLVFDDQNFCVRVYDALKDHVKKPVKEIGDIDLPT